MKSIAVIPARMASTRFPGKPLAKISGVPMIGHCWFRTRMASGLSETYIATCDEVIADYARSIGAKAIMTSDAHERATDRTAEAMLVAESELGYKVDVVLMMQGDEPLITPSAIDNLLSVLVDPTIEIANLMCVPRTEDDFRDKHNVKVVTDREGDALYFSREPIPSDWKRLPGLPMRVQLGVIAFQRDVLLGFNDTPETELERFESVDMNRVVENGGRIRMVLNESRTIGVDTPADLAAAELLMANDQLFAQYKNL